MLRAILNGDDKGSAFPAGANIMSPKTHTRNSVAQFIKELRKLQLFEVLTNVPIDHFSFGSSRRKWSIFMISRKYVVANRAGSLGICSRLSQTWRPS